MNSRITGHFLAATIYHMRLSVFFLLVFLTTSFVSAQEGATLWGFEIEDAAPPQAAKDRDTPNWNAQTGVLWNERPLRETLSDFAAHHHLGFLLDRRIDPGTLFSLDIKQTTVRNVFEQAAEQCGLALCEFDTVAYIGPKAAAEQLRLLAVLRSEQLAKLPENKRATMLTPLSFHTGPFDEPTVTLQRLAASIGFDGETFERLPHDVWPELHFPNESPSVIFSLLLIGFDRTFAVSKDATKLGPIPIPREMVVAREYKGVIARRLTESELLQLAPDAQIAPIPQGVGVEAPFEQLARIETLIARRTAESQREEIAAQTNRNQPDRSSNGASNAGDAATRLQNERFTIKNLDASLDRVLKTLTDRMQLELVIDEESFAANKVRLDTRISTSFEQADYVEVFEKCLNPVGAKFRIQGNTITVFME